MKRWSEQITYILRQSAKSITSWHWLLVMAVDSQECGMPWQQRRMVSAHLKVSLMSLAFLLEEERNLNSTALGVQRWNDTPFKWWIQKCVSAKPWNKTLQSRVQPITILNLEEKQSISFEEHQLYNTMNKSQTIKMFTKESSSFMKDPKYQSAP